MSQPSRRSASALLPTMVTGSTLAPSRSRLTGFERHSSKASSSRCRVGGTSTSVYVARAAFFGRPGCASAASPPPPPPPPPPSVVAVALPSLLSMSLPWC